MRSSNIGLIRNESIIMKNLIIVGARGWGREVYMAAITCPAYYKQKAYEVKGFLDTDMSLFDGMRGIYPPILGSPEDYQIEKDDVFFVAMGDPQWRRYYAEMLEKKGAQFQTIICEGAFVNPSALIGAGGFVACWANVSDNVKIGMHSVVHPYANIGHDVLIGDYVTIESYCFVGGKAKIDDDSTMHVRSTLIRHKSIGKHVEVGAHSLVMRSIKDGEHVFGIPAQKIEY